MLFFLGALSAGPFFLACRDPTLLFCSLLFVVCGRVFFPSKNVFPCLDLHEVLVAGTSVCVGPTPLRNVVFFGNIRKLGANQWCGGTRFFDLSRKQLQLNVVGQWLVKMWIPSIPHDVAVAISIDSIGPFPASD